MSFVVDAIGGYFEGRNQKTAGQSTLSAYEDAEDQSKLGYTQARDAGLGAWTDARNTGMDANTGARDAQLAAWQPYQAQGLNALNRASDMQSGGFQYSPSDPSYAWRLGQGIEAIDRSASARGTMDSGGQQKALMRYGQGMASTEFAADFARNNQLAGYGVLGAQGISGAQGQYANNVNSLMTNYAGGVGSAWDNYARGIANTSFVAANGKADGYGIKADGKNTMAGAITGGISNGLQPNPLTPGSNYFGF